VKVRIRATPQEQELDGVRLDGFRPGAVREVSASVGAWLIANGYADAEMRRASSADQQAFSGLMEFREPVMDHPHRRGTDR
jgi:nicotinic acid phosphoribosyltransferase